MSLYVQNSPISMLCKRFLFKFNAMSLAVRRNNMSVVDFAHGSFTLRWEI